jgi:hypothetical protein
MMPGDNYYFMAQISAFEETWHWENLAAMPRDSIFDDIAFCITASPIDLPKKRHQKGLSRKKLKKITHKTLMHSTTCRKQLNH